MAGRKVEVLWRKAEEGSSILPTRGTRWSAGWDLVTTKDVKFSFWDNVKALFGFGEPKMIHTGIELAIPHGYYGELSLRSGFAKKNRVRLTNGVGVIDSDYRGEILGGLALTGWKLDKIEAGTRIFQIVIHKIPDIHMLEADWIDENTERGKGGFGSTGEK